MTIAIRRAALADLDRLVPLFDGYRVFYAQPSDPVRARDFLEQRMHRDESVVLMATLEDDDVPAGFTQLYPMFSSVRTARIWILNDLFVAPAARKRGVARALLQAARDFAQADGAIRLELETTPDNLAAQTLYRDCGWLDDDGSSPRFHLPLTA